MELMIKPIGQQTQAIEFLSQKSGIVQAPTGAGKTIIAAFVIKNIRKSTLVFTTPKNKTHIKSEFVACGISPSLIKIINRSSDIDPSKPMIYIAHWQQLYSKGYLPILKKLRPYLIVGDEIHRINGYKAKTREYLNSIKCQHRIGLTATEASKGVDMWQSLNWVNPRKYSNYYRFRDFNFWVKKIWKTNPKTGKKFQVPLVGNCKSEEKLYNYIKDEYLSIEVEGLPELTITTVKIPLTTKMYKNYQAFEGADDVLVTLPDGDEHLIQIQLTAFLKMRQVSECWDSSSEKIKWVLDWLEDNPNESVLVATEFRETVDVLHELTGIPTIYQFKDSPELITKQPRLLTTVAAGGESLNFKDTDYIIMTAPDWSPIKYQQLCGRITRLSSKNKHKQMYLLQSVSPKGHDLVDHYVQEVMTGNLTLVQAVRELSRNDN